MNSETDGGEVTLLGKVPARADFVRLNHGSALAMAFDQWLEHNLEELLLAGKRSLPAARFMFTEGDGGGALVGALAPSRDKAGRAFPITLFAAAPPSVLSARPFAVPAASEPLLQAAEGFFDELGGLDYDAIKARMAQFTAPSADDYATAAEAVSTQLAATGPEAFAERVFGSAQQAGEQVGVGHALLTVRELGRRGGRVVECPVVEPIDAAFWLALAHGGGAAALCYCWTRPDETSVASRLLLSAGRAPNHTLLWLAAPKPAAGKFSVLSSPASMGLDGDRDPGRQEHDAFMRSQSLASYLEQRSRD